MILYRYIIKEHILPFLYSLGIIIFIFTMTTAVQLLDKIISKGLSPGVVLEIFAIQLGWIVALAIPMSILTSTLMTFGSMSANNEIMAVKSTGQSLFYLITPVFAASCLLAACNIYFNDLILPNANHRAASLMSDISRKRPALFIEPGVLIRDFPNYTLWVKKVDQKTGMMENVRVYSAPPGENPQTIISEAGDIKLTGDGKDIEITLYNGETHSTNAKNPKENFVCKFKKQIFFLQNPDTELRRTNRDYRSDREMSAEMMINLINGYKKTKSDYIREHSQHLASEIANIKNIDTLLVKYPQLKNTADTVSSFADWTATVKNSLSPAVADIKTKQGVTGRLLSKIRFQDMQINQYLVEVHKKYAMPIACIVFVLIGAPLGIMAKRGGITVGASYSLFFFILYWAILIWGESLADKCIIPAWLAMWGGDILIGMCGIVLMLTVRRESTLFSFAPVVKFIFAARQKMSKNAPGAKSGAGRIIRIISDIPYFAVRKIAGTLPTYLIRKFIGSLIGILIAIIIVFVVVDYISNLQRFETASIAEIILYYWYYLPWLVQIVSPIVILLASMSAIGSMAKWNELTAMKAAGINVRQLAGPLLFLGLCIVGLEFYLGEQILPKSNMQRRELTDSIGKHKAEIKKKNVVSAQESRHDFYYFGDDKNIYFFKNFKVSAAKAENVWKETYSGSIIVNKITAAEAVYRNRSWYFINGNRRTFDSTGQIMTPFDTLRDTLLTSKPADMAAVIKSPEEMSYWELRGFVDKTRRRGENVARYRAQLNFKLALPVMNFIVILLGISISARAGRKGGAVLFGIGLLLTFSYWIISQFSLAFAQNGQIPPMIGAWFGNSLFLIIALFLYTKASR
jgi:lipopolysaccharide export system permease protein